MSNVKPQIIEIGFVCDLNFNIWNSFDIWILNFEIYAFSRRCLKNCAV